MAIFKVKYKVNSQFYNYTDGKYKDDEAISDVIGYVMSPAKTPSGYVGGINIEHLPQAAEEMTAVTRHFGKESGVRLRHMLLSFQPEEGVSAYQALFLAYEIAAYYKDAYQLAFAVHEDNKAPHIHFVMNPVSLVTGLKYRGRRDDYYRFQAHIRKVLWDYAGITTLIAVKDR